ncbi:MAG: aldo/keto reductase [Hyphomicrobiales bacterium]|nr:aldo/keto reductase [Hyphomicrobiales bacterium]MDE2113240.1 aldo/keto reductase [Hyphomicrobiales bacterium]
MEMRKLGRDGPNVSVICLGTMTWGQQNTEAEGHEQMDYALAHGVNFFDTAEIYSIPPKAETQGSTETIIGKWFKARKNRDKVVLASKVAGRSAFNWLRDDGASAQLSRKQMTEALEKSLKRLQTDYLDLYQLHAPDRAVTAWGSNPTVYKVPPKSEENPIEEILDVLNGFVKAGKVRQVGLSNETAWGTMRFVTAAEARSQVRVASIQNAYNFLNRTFEIGLAEVAMREHVGLLAYSPLAQGYLTGKYLDGARPAGARTTLFNRGQRYETPGSDVAIRAYVALAREFGMDPAQMALAFVNLRPFVTANIIGATSMDQLKIAIGSHDLKISPELEARIDAIHQLHMNPCP